MTPIALFAIIFPTCLMIFVTIKLCDDAALADTAHYKFHVTVLLCATMFMSLKYFYLVSFTEPGILPSVQMNSEIPNYSNKKPCNIRDYYIEYESKQ
jgi:hypothetical protein